MRRWKKKKKKSLEQPSSRSIPISTALQRVLQEILYATVMLLPDSLKICSLTKSEEPDGRSDRHCRDCRNDDGDVEDAQDTSARTGFAGVEDGEERIAE